MSTRKILSLSLWLKMVEPRLAENSLQSHMMCLSILKGH